MIKKVTVKSDRKYAHLLKNSFSICFEIINIVQGLKPIGIFLYIIAATPEVKATIRPATEAQAAPSDSIPTPCIKIAFRIMFTPKVPNPHIIVYLP
ncbi:MAG: hypothetical protein DSZ21_01675 [Tenericutes bacterium]|nr:MAG: hypothetical protein DSZ21_01675 [Mycoplasmatota bacterium]